MIKLSTEPFIALIVNDVGKSSRMNYRSHSWADVVHIIFPFGPRRRYDGELLVSPATPSPLPGHGFVAAAGGRLLRLLFPHQVHWFLPQEWWIQLVDAGAGKFPASEEVCAGEERRRRWCEGWGNFLPWRQVFLGSCAKLNITSLYLKWGVTILLMQFSYILKEN